MRRLLRAHEKKVRYVAAGAWNTLFGYGVFIVLYKAAKAAGVHYLAALAASNVLAIANAYLSYKHLVFKTSGFAMVREFFRFSLVYWAIFAANMAVLPAFVSATRLSPIVAQGVFLAVTVAASYVAHSRFSFGSGADAA